MMKLYWKLLFYYLNHFYNLDSFVECHRYLSMAYVSYCQYPIFVMSNTEPGVLCQKQPKYYAGDEECILDRSGLPCNFQSFLVVNRPFVGAVVYEIELLIKKNASL